MSREIQPRRVSGSAQRSPRTPCAELDPEKAPGPRIGPHLFRTRSVRATLGDAAFPWRPAFQQSALFYVVTVTAHAAGSPVAPVLLSLIPLLVPVSVDAYGDRLPPGAGAGLGSGGGGCADPPEDV